MIFSITVESIISSESSMNSEVHVLTYNCSATLLVFDHLLQVARTTPDLQGIFFSPSPCFASRKKKHSPTFKMHFSHPLILPSRLIHPLIKSTPTPLNASTAHPGYLPFSPPYIFPKYPLKNSGYPSSKIASRTLRIKSSKKCTL